MARIALVVPMTFPQYHDYLRTAEVPVDAPKFDVSSNGGKLMTAQRKELDSLMQNALISGAEPLAPVEIDLDYTPSEFRRASPAWADMPEFFKEMNRRGNEAARAAFLGDPSKLTVFRDDMEEIALQASGQLDPETRSKALSDLTGPNPLIGDRATIAQMIAKIAGASDVAYEREMLEAHAKLTRASKQLVRRDDLAALDTMIHIILDGLKIDAGSAESALIHKLAEKSMTFGIQIALANVVGGRVKLEVVGEVENPITGEE